MPCTVAMKIACFATCPNNNRVHGILVSDQQFTSPRSSRVPDACLVQKCKMKKQLKYRVEPNQSGQHQAGDVTG